MFDILKKTIKEEIKEELKEELKTGEDDITENSYSYSKEDVMNEVKKVIDIDDECDIDMQKGTIIIKRTDDVLREGKIISCNYTDSHLMKRLIRVRISPNVIKTFDERQGYHIVDKDPVWITKTTMLYAISFKVYAKQIDDTTYTTRVVIEKIIDYLKNKEVRSMK